VQAVYAAGLGALHAVVAEAEPALWRRCLALPTLLARAPTLGAALQLCADRLSGVLSSRADCCGGEWGELFRLARDALAEALTKGAPPQPQQPQQQQQQQQQRQQQLAQTLPQPRRRYIAAPGLSPELCWRGDGIVSRARHRSLLHRCHWL
jgi:hypothetical protein